MAALPNQRITEKIFPKINDAWISSVDECPSLGMTAKHVLCSMRVLND
jgi:hypothetical protein